MENKDTQNMKAAESALATYGMISEPDAELFDSLHDDQSPYTLEELNARIDEAEAEMDRGEGKSFVEMMNDFKKELLWLK